MRSVVRWCLLILPLSGSLAAQSKVSLGKPDAESGEGFTNITSIRELANGKVLVADIQDKVVQLVDLASGTMTKVGREGRGPGEYALPAGLLGLPNGSTLVNDMLNRRFLVIGPDGKPGDVADLPPSPSSGPGGGLTLGGPMLVDARGRLFRQGTPFSFQTGTQLDSVPILRWDRTSPTLDTVAYFKLPAGSASMNRSGAGGGNVSVRIGGGQKVFAPAEAWTVTGDGRIARVMPAPYRVVWYDALTRATAGPVQPYTPIRVGEAEKAQVRELRKRQKPVVVTFGGGGGGAPPPQVQLPEPEFEETIPPFSTAGVLGTPDGEVWVLRNRPASDKIPTYDVFDRTGALVKKVTLEPNSRIVGFGKGTVYVAKNDEDDLQYLQRYRKP
jgi:hypothetical protein